MFLQNLNKKIYIYIKITKKKKKPVIVVTKK